MSQVNVIGPDLNTNIYFSDFDFDFSPHPKTGDIVVLKNNNAVQNSIKNLLQTKFGEILFNPDLGSGVKFSMFDPIDNITIYTLEKEITTTINNFEPRASIQNIEIVEDKDKNGIFIYIYYSIINFHQIFTVQVFLQRIR